MRAVVVNLGGTFDSYRSRGDQVIDDHQARASTRANTGTGHGWMRQAVVQPWNGPSGPRPAATAAERAQALCRVDPIEKDGPVSYVRLGALSPERVQAAAEQVDAVVPAGTAMVDRASSILHTLAAEEAMGIPVTAPAPAPAVIPSPQVQIRQTRPAGRAANPQVRQSRPLAEALRQAAEGPAPGRPVRDIELPGSNGNGHYAPPVLVIPTPEIGITFEIEGFGTHTAYYHEVIVLPAQIVLAWHTKYRGNHYFPPAHQDKMPPLAMQIHGQNRVYQVHATGMIIPFQDYELCALLIEKAVELTEPPPEEPTS